MSATAVTIERTTPFHIVRDALQDLREGFGQDDAGEITPDTALYGGESVLDSLSLVLLVSAVEEAIRERLGVDVLLASERAMSQRQSPYRTVGAFVEFIEAELAAR